MLAVDIQQSTFGWSSLQSQNQEAGFHMLFIKYRVKHQKNQRLSEIKITATLT